MLNLDQIVSVDFDDDKHTADVVMTRAPDFHFEDADADRLHEMLHAISQPQTWSGLIDDVENAEGEPLGIEVDCHDRGVEIAFDDYGVMTMVPEHGHPVLIENRGDVPHVCVWADITQEDPTHVISLEGAHERHRDG
jgi:hypothetical protein